MDIELLHTHRRACIDCPCVYGVPSYKPKKEAKVKLSIHFNSALNDKKVSSLCIPW